MPDLTKLGRTLFDQVKAEEGAKDQADLEAWYQDYHHWNHDDPSDRSAGFGASTNFAESAWFGLFRKAMGLPMEPSTPNPYRRYKYFADRK